MPATVYASKGDRGRKIWIHAMREICDPLEFLPTYQYGLTVRRPDNHVEGTSDISVVYFYPREYNILEVVLDPFLTSISGDCLCSLGIYTGSEFIRLQPFHLFVEDF